jgi:hypothetical protein
MIKWLRFSRRALILGVACGLGMLAFEGRAARAASLELIVTESGGAPITIGDNTSLDTDPTVGVINVDTNPATGINLLLTNYMFTALGANSNSPGTAALGFLSQNGTAQLLLGGTGSITVLASDIDYNRPNVPPGTMHSSASNTYTNATAGNTDTFQSWFNGTNTLGAKETPSPVVTLTSTAGNPNSQSGDAAPTPITLVTPYGLTNQKVITLTGGAVGALAQDQYTGSTTITGGTVIPEPASMALMLTALPVAVFGVVRRRKAGA